MSIDGFSAAAKPPWPARARQEVSCRSGQPPDQPFGGNRQDFPAEVAFGLGRFALKNGDLDVNMLGRLWRYCEDDPVIFPLGRRMLQMVIEAPDTVFARTRKLGFERYGRKRPERRGLLGDGPEE